MLERPPTGRKAQFHKVITYRRKVRTPTVIFSTEVRGILHYSSCSGGAN